MKWSEQMRVLNSEDEHYNQLVYAVDKKELYINDKLIAITGSGHSISKDTFCDLKKKYPYIDDKNFLLNCLFKIKDETGYLYGRPTFVHYSKSNNGSCIIITTQYGNTGYMLCFITDEELQGPE